MGECLYQKRGLEASEENDTLMVGRHARSNLDF